MSEIEIFQKIENDIHTDILIIYRISGDFYTCRCSAEVLKMFNKCVFIFYKTYLMDVKPIFQMRIYPLNLLEKYIETESSIYEKMKTGKSLFLQNLKEEFLNRIMEKIASIGGEIVTIRGYQHKKERRFDNMFLNNKTRLNLDAQAPINMSAKSKIALLEALFDEGKYLSGYLLYKIATYSDFVFRRELYKTKAPDQIEMAQKYYYSVKRKALEKTDFNIDRFYNLRDMIFFALFSSDTELLFDVRRIFNYYARGYKEIPKDMEKIIGELSVLTKIKINRAKGCFISMELIDFLFNKMEVKNDTREIENANSSAKSLDRDRR